MQRRGLEDVSSPLFHLLLLIDNEESNKKKYRDPPKYILYVTRLPVKIILGGFGPNGKKLPDSFLFGHFPLPRWFIHDQQPTNTVNRGLMAPLAHQLTA